MELFSHVFDRKLLEESEFDDAAETLVDLRDVLDGLFEFFFRLRSGRVWHVEDLVDRQSECATLSFHRISFARIVDQGAFHGACEQSEEMFSVLNIQRARKETYIRFVNEAFDRQGMIVPFSAHEMRCDSTQLLVNKGPAEISRFNEAWLRLV